MKTTYTRADFDIVIGMEFHVQVKANTKLFSQASLSFGDEVNTHVSILDAGMPGALPCVNKHCVECAIQTGLAFNMQINPLSHFDRKHYSYPDLPLKYQITQFYTPIAQDGFLIINERKIRLERLSLEADAGKNIHAGDHTYVDLNRCGTALMEIVTSPDLQSEDEAADLFRQIRSVVRYIDTSDADMEKGQLRADVNISINLKGQPWGTRVEIKNINSMNFAHQALTYEIDRQIKCINNGDKIIMETRTFDPNTKRTSPMREKETDADYRYMPDPDLLPIQLLQSDIDAFKAKLPELPFAKKQRWMSEYNLEEYDCNILADDCVTANFFDETIKHCLEMKASKDAIKQISSWMLGDFFALLNKHSLDITQSKISPLSLAQLVYAVTSEKISGKQAKDVLKEMFELGKNANDIIKDNNLEQISDTITLMEFVQKVITLHPKEVKQVQEGNKNIFGFLVGQAVKLSHGKGNPKILTTLFQTELNIK